MIYFSPARVLFLVLGAVFFSSAILFLLTRTKRVEFKLCAAFFGLFGIFFVFLAFLDMLEPFLGTFIYVALLTIGLPLVPIGLVLFGTLFGETEGMRRWLLPCIVGTLVDWLVCMLMLVVGINELWPLIVCRVWAFGCYAVAITVEIHRLRPLGRLPRQLQLFLVFIGLCILTLAALVVFMCLGLYSSLSFFWMLLAILFCVAAGILYRYPQTFRLLEEQSKDVHSSRSLLGNIDVHAKLGEIDRLMREEKIYRDPDLSLEQLAKRGQLSRHQLSELLNTYAKQNFFGYVTKFRVDQAKRELLDPRCGTILDIAFSCGFNAKSTFNQAFHKATGLTPSAYRTAERAQASNNPTKSSAP